MFPNFLPNLMDQILWLNNIKIQILLSKNHPKVQKEINFFNKIYNKDKNITILGK